MSKKNNEEKREYKEFKVEDKKKIILTIIECAKSTKTILFQVLNSLGTWLEFRSSSPVFFTFHSFLLTLR